MHSHYQRKEVKLMSKYEAPQLVPIANALDVVRQNNGQKDGGGGDGQLCGPYFCALHELDD